MKLEDVCKKLQAESEKYESISEREAFLRGAGLAKYLVLLYKGCEHAKSNYT